MMTTSSNIVLLVTATTTALMAGLFFAWSVSVMPGLARLPDVEFITAFQAMNRAILNPVFLMCFLGTALLLPIATYMQYTPSLPVRFWFLLAASVVYLFGVMGITMAGNVPLNEALDSFHTHTASAGEIAAQRLKFEAPWNKLNTIRTIASFLAIVLVVIACLSRTTPVQPEG